MTRGKVARAPLTWSSQHYYDEQEGRGNEGEAVCPDAVSAEGSNKGIKMPQY